MQEYINLMVKCFIVYFVIIFALRIMGKREVGELSVFDIVIYLVPIFTLAFLQIVISWVLLKSKKTRDIFDGKNAILIHNGHINQSIMKRERYNIDDLMSQIRSKDLCTPDEVAFAVLENNGQLSILPKNKCKVKHPDPLISDGTINKKALQDLSRDEEWLKNALQKEGVDSVGDVFLCIYQNNGMFVIKKEMNSKDTFF